MIRRMTIESPIGRLLIAEDKEGICGIYRMEQDEEKPEEQRTALLEQAALELQEYFEGRRTVFGFPLSMRGSPFERAVWQALTEIPYGETRTYGELAAGLSRPKGARAVGGACSRNPILIAVPCHRVIASSGALTGFAAGMEAKRSLLELEGHAISGDRLRTES